VDAFGQEHKPDLVISEIAWESLDLEQFNQIPAFLRPVFKSFGSSSRDFISFPIESGRGALTCEFCTVTGFFGDSIRFVRTRA